MASAGTRRAGWAVVLVGLAAAVMLLLRSTPTGSLATAMDAGTATAATPGASPAPTAPAVPPAAPAPSTAPPAPVRVELPRVAAPPAGGRRAVLDLAPDVHLPTDRRANPGPRAKAQLEILGYAFQTLREDVDDCLRQWGAMDAGAQGEVMLVFELDADGLQKSWVEGATEVPFGPRSCIANAVYGLDWSGVADEPVKVSQRFELGDRDAGP